MINRSPDDFIVQYLAFRLNLIHHYSRGHQNSTAAKTIVIKWEKSRLGRVIKSNQCSKYHYKYDFLSAQTYI